MSVPPELVRPSDDRAGEHRIGDDRPADDEPAPLTQDEAGSLVTEYGLIAVVAATIAAVVLQWASSGALVGLFNALISRARDLVGA